MNQHANQQAHALGRIAPIISHGNMHILQVKLLF
jgi:hypothetical protein